MKLEQVSNAGGSSKPINRTRICRLTLSQWEEYIEAHPASTIFHHRAWLELLIEQYGMKLQIWGAFEDGEIVAALPLLEKRRLGRGRSLTALPFSDVVPYLYRTLEDGERLLQQLARILPVDIQSIVLRSDKVLSPAQCEAAFVQHVIDLRPPLEDIEARYHKNLRRNLRRASESNLQFETGDDMASMDDFYRLHLLTRRKHGVPIQPKSFFVRLQKQLFEQRLGFIARIRLNDQPVAAAVFLQYQDKFVYKYGASHPDYLSYRPNDLLISHGIRIAKGSGCTSFDFGVSGIHQQGLRRFKSKWGAVESDVYHCHLRGEPRSSTTDTLLFRLVSRLLRISPTWFCQAAGELGYRFVA